MSKYPKVNYIGNKEKISNWIIENLPLTSGRVLDLFSGGCSVSYVLKKSGFEVLTNDILYSSYCISKSIIENSLETINIEIDEQNILFYFSQKTYEYIKWMENKLYFPNETKELSCLINYSYSLEGYSKYLFLSLLRRAMIRKLPYSRMNIKWDEIVKLRDEEYSYLKYKRRRAYHNKSFLFHIQDNLSEYNMAIFDNGKQNKAYQSDAFDMLHNLEKAVDIIYIDPPYPSTMNKYYEFYGAYDFMFNKNIKYTDFTNKNTFINNLIKLVKLSENKTKYIVISLNNNTVPSYTDILNSMDNLVKDISIKEKKHTYQITGKENKNNNYEILIILEV